MLYTSSVGIPGLEKRVDGRDVGLQCMGKAGHPSFQGLAGAGAHMAVKVHGESCPSFPGVAARNEMSM